MATMTSRERLLTALEGGVPDRLPVTTHHVMPSFLDSYMDGISYPEFFDRFGLDAIRWVVDTKPGKDTDYYDPSHVPGFLEARRVSSDDWRIEPVKESEEMTRYNFHTPKKTLTMLVGSDRHTSWVWEPLLKEKSDIDILGEYMTHPVCDVEAVNRQAEEFGDRGLVRGHVVYFDVYGQPGCWQDAMCLYGMEQMIYATYEDPEWVHAFLKILQERKKTYVKSLKGAKYDLLELGGGSGSTSVISPKIFDKFVAPYDAELIGLAHEAGQRIVYHTCGKMMPILESIAGMGVDAMETFTPYAMSGDTRLAEAKQRIGSRVCMIGGFDQFNYFLKCTEEETRAEVRRCFEEAGRNGGYILAPSDHFFDADLKLLEAFADEARKCSYRE